MKIQFWLILSLQIQLVGTAAAATPHTSHHELSFGNGHCAAVYDVTHARVTTLTEHLYAHKSATEETVNLCFDAYFGLRDGGKNSWLRDVIIDEVSYVSGAGVVKVEQSHGNLTAEQYFFSPWGLAHPALAMLVKVRAVADTSDSALFSLHNFHLGSGHDRFDNEQVDYNPAQQAYTERGLTTSRVMITKSLTTPDRHGATPQDPFVLVSNGGLLQDVDSSGLVTNAVTGYQYDLDLKAGDVAWYGVVHVAGTVANINQLAIDLESYIGGRGPAQLLKDELQDWTDWHGADITPPGLSTDELAVYRQALNVLRMSQCREANDPFGKPFGQLVASMPPGKWNISWVRDAAYAITALAQAGHLTEARDALFFMLQGTAGGYICCDKQGGSYVGVPYAISVTRYYGNGQEESDSNSDGPNIEFDNFGLFLWATEAVISRMSSTDAQQFLSQWYDVLTVGVADVLLSLVEPETGILRADSSIWEHHWDNGKRRHHTYSNVMAVSGLRAMARLSDMFGVQADEIRYNTAADDLAAAVASRLVDVTTGILTSDLESVPEGPDSFMDAAVVEAFLHEVLPLKGAVADSTLAAFETHLGLPTGPGYIRNDDGDTYDKQEWVMVDLRISAARFLRGEHAEGQTILDWITGMARLNYDLIPELLDHKSADYKGEIPMAGFGAGAFIMALHSRGEQPLPPADGGSPRLDSGLTDGRSDALRKLADARPGGLGVQLPVLPANGSGCGCQVNSPSESWAGLVLLIAGLGLLSTRRRRREGALKG